MQSSACTIEWWINIHPLCGTTIRHLPLFLQAIVVLCERRYCCCVRWMLLCSTWIKLYVLVFWCVRWCNLFEHVSNCKHQMLRCQPCLLIRWHIFVAVVGAVRRHSIFPILFILFAAAISFIICSLLRFDCRSFAHPR